MHIEKLSERVIKIILDPALYELEVIYKCFYWYGDNYVIEIEQDKGFYSIKLSKQTSDIDAELFQHLIAKIKNDLIDYKTRQIIHSETKDIKDILIAKAFSRLDIYDETPKGEIEDPVGFKTD